MACCSEYQTECLRVVTIGYIKSFIGNNIQDSSGNVVTVSSSYTNDSYCPTYAELTSGSVIQTSLLKSHPKNDRDGIFVNQTHIGTSSSYKNNQLVDQADFGIRYTRLESTSISASTLEISECGGSSVLRCKASYKRYTKSIDNVCDVEEVNSGVTKTTGNTVSYSISGSPQYGTISSNVYTIGKNGTIPSPARSDTVYAVITYRKHSYTSNYITITQNALIADTCCDDLEYRIGDCPSDVTDLDSCSSSGTVEITAQSRCRNGEGSWETYTNLSITWSFVSGSDFVTFDSNEKTKYISSDNCDSEARSGTYKALIIVNDDTTVQKECTITFSQDAGPCENCECTCDNLTIIQI